MANSYKIVADGGLVIPVLASDPSSPENGTMWYNSTSNVFKKRENGATSTISSGEISDSSFRIIDDGDGTKKIAFEASGITTGNTRTITMPDANVNLADANNALLKNGSRPLDNSAFLKGRNAANSADINIVRVDSSDNIQFRSGGLIDVNTGALTNTADITPDADATRVLGSGSQRYNYVNTLNVNSGSSPLNIITTGGNSNIVLDPHGTGSVSVSSARVINAADPVNPQDLATKNYVDGAVSGLDVKQSVRLATTGVLPANTPSGSGVGKTLTADSNGALSVDSVTPSVGNRLLVKNETAGENNGVYIVTQVGDGSNPFILTRATDYDQNAEVTANSFFFVEEGTVNSDTGWTLTTNDPITVDSTSLSFSQFSGAGQIVAGEGLSKTGNTLDVNVDNSTIEINSDTLRQKDGGTTNAKLANMPAWSIKVRNNAASGVPSDAQAADISTKATPTTSDTVFGFDAANSNALSKVTLGSLPISSATQSALDGKASTSLNNLASTAINVSLISDTDNTDDLGSQSINWKDVHAKSLKSTNGLTLDGDTDAVGDRATDITQLAKSVKRGKQASALIEEEYVDSTTLSDNTTAVVAAFTFALATYNAIQIDYLIKEATSLDTRVGKLMVVTNGTTTSITDVFTETGSPAVSWSAAVNGANVEISYTTASSGNARTMRADLKRFRAI